MSWLCKTDSNGFIVAKFSAAEFTQEGLACPLNEPQNGFVWRRVNEAWVEHLDKRGQMFYNPALTETLEVHKISSLIDEPPEGWLSYGQTQWEQESIALAWQAARTRRQADLVASDWTDTLSSAQRLGEVAYAEWQTYRQALRDITLQPDPSNLTWPLKPQSQPPS